MDLFSVARPQEDRTIRKIYIGIWLLAAVAVLVSTALPLLRRDEWWIRWFDFPRLQIMLIGAVLIGLQLLWGLRIGRLGAAMSVLLLVAVGYQAYRMFPYTSLARVQVQDAGEARSVVVRLVTANVLMHNRSSEAYLRVVAEVKPDIILTTEADQWWADQLKALDDAYPYQVRHPLDNTYGMILHSRFPLIEPSVRFLVESGVPSIHSGMQLPDGGVLQFIGLHPRPPGPTENPESTERDAELIMVGKSIKESDLPVMVLGDLNDVAWSYTTTLFQKISGLLDPRIGRGMFNTYHADYVFIRFPLDHIFHSAHFKLIDMRRLPHIGSDHFPIYAALSYTPQEASSPKPPEEPDPGEKKEADETLEEAGEK